MTRTLTAVREWLRPGSVHRESVPPFDGGLRANEDLDAAWAVVSCGEDQEPDDLVLMSNGRLVFSVGAELWHVDWPVSQVTRQLGSTNLLARLPGRVSALGASAANEIVAAVEGLGIVTVGPDGAVRTVCADESVTGCVTDLLVHDDALVLTVGSSRFTSDEWSRALISGDATGQIVTVRAGKATVVAERLAWPAGLCRYAGSLAVSMSLSHRLELWELETGRAHHKEDLVSRLPVYPGRIRPSTEGWWVAAPYARNRLTELLLDEPLLLRRLQSEVEPGLWPLPRLRPDNIYRDPMQLGQLRVLGVVKPWAPPRSYGLAFLVDSHGLITRSHHSRITGECHGVTGLAVSADGTVVLAVRGARRIVAIDPTTTREGNNDD